MVGVLEPVTVQVQTHQLSFFRALSHASKVTGIASERAARRPPGRPAAGNTKAWWLYAAWCVTGCEVFDTALAVGGGDLPLTHLVIEVSLETLAASETTADPPPPDSQAWTYARTRTQLERAVEEADVARAQRDVESSESPAGQLGMGRSLGMTRHTGHSTTDSRSPS